MHNIVYKLSEDYEDTRMKISGIKLRLSQKGRQQQNQVVQNPFSLETDVIELSTEKGNSQSRREGWDRFFLSPPRLFQLGGGGRKKKVKIEQLGRGGGGELTWIGWSPLRQDCHASRLMLPWQSSFEQLCPASYFSFLNVFDFLTKLFSLTSAINMRKRLWIIYSVMSV